MYNYGSMAAGSLVNKSHVEPFAVGGASATAIDFRTPSTAPGQPLFALNEQTNAPHLAANC